MVVLVDITQTAVVTLALAAAAAAVAARATALQIAFLAVLVVMWRCTWRRWYVLMLVRLLHMHILSYSVSAVQWRHQAKTETKSTSANVLL